jgi:hypothetical protein
LVPIHYRVREIKYRIVQKHAKDIVFFKIGKGKMEIYGFYKILLFVLVIGGEKILSL